MKKISALLSAAAVALGMVGTPAHADTVWNFTYSGSGVSASGSFTTIGNGASPSEVLSMSGTYSDGTTTGALSLVTLAGNGASVTTPDGLYIADNLFGGSPQIDNSGLLFLAGSQEVNLYADPGTGLTNVTSYNGSYVFSPVHFSATAVSEPGSIAMLLAGLGAMGFVGRRKARA